MDSWTRHAEHPSEPSSGIPDFQGMSDLSGDKPNSDGKADILADMLSLDDLVAGQASNTSDALAPARLRMMASI